MVVGERCCSRETAEGELGGKALRDRRGVEWEGEWAVVWGGGELAVLGHGERDVWMVGVRR